MIKKILYTLENKSKIFYQVSKLMHRVYISVQNLHLEYEAKKRKKGFHDKRYAEIKELKDTMAGKRCFVIATGPSLTLDDVLLLKDEFTFGMNSVCLLYDKTDWRASMFMIQDEDVYQKIEPVLLENPDNVFVSPNIKERYEESNVFAGFPLNTKYMYYDYRYTNKLHVKFSNDAYSVVYDAYSITFSIIQTAVYMGFKEIYLLGCDCNQEVGKKNHFIETGHVEAADKLRTSAERNMYSHNQIKAFCEKNGVKIYNATRGGKLEVYERVNLDDIVAK